MSIEVALDQDACLQLLSGATFGRVASASRRSPASSRCGSTSTAAASTLSAHASG
jgi:hypothetical protein